MRFIVAACVLLGLGLATAAPCMDDSECQLGQFGFSGICVNGQCACAFEWYGQDCECDIPSENLASDNAVAIAAGETGFSSFDHLTIGVDISKKYYNVRNSFVDATTGAELCQHLAWQSTVSGPFENDCKDLYWVDAEWAELRDFCGFSLIAEDNQYRYFEGTVRATVEETLDSARNTAYFRRLTYDLRVQVWLPTTVTVTTDILVYSDINLFARLVEQYTADDFGDGFFIFSTNVQYPYMLVNPSIDFSAVADVAIQETNQGQPTPTCTGMTDDPCLQNFWVDMSLRSSCHFDDTYRTRFEIACVGAFNGDCPRQGEEIIVDLVIASNDVCPHVVAIAEIDASIVAYETGALTIPTDKIMADRLVFFEITTWSPQVSVTSSTITRITVQDTRAHPGFYTLYDNGYTTVGTQASLDIRNSGVAGFDSNIVARDNAEFAYVANHIYPTSVWHEDDWTNQVIVVDLYVILGHAKKHIQKTVTLSQEDGSSEATITIQVNGEDVAIDHSVSSDGSSSSANAPSADSSASTTTPAICAASMFVAFAMLA